MEERIAVFGAGISGQAAARLAGREGAKVTLFDQKTEGANAIFEQADLDQFDRFVFSPGFAATHPWRLLVVGSGKPCYGEFSYAASKWKGPLIAITGTNGKTTTTELLRDALIAVGKSAHAVGNIGMPLSELICEGANDGETIAVCEVSSFQAELCAGLQVDALIWTNFSEDHLDRYESIEDYFRAKANLLGSLKEGAPFILGEDVQRLIESHGIRVASAVSAADAGLDDLSVDSAFRRFPFAHNFQLVATYWELAGYDRPSLLAAANRYELAAHRLDAVHEVGAVRFWDDSKATNFHAALAAINALEAPIFWIGGGQSKGGELEAFASLVAERVERAYLYGEVGRSLGTALGNLLAEVVIYSSFRDAVEAAAKDALERGEGEVLLSPGFSSFDQFRSYSERGKSFISIVLSLNEGRTAR